MSVHFADHPKVIALSDKAFRAHVTALCYVARHETDGVYAAAGVPPKYAQELVACGLWVMVGLGFEIHDWADYIPPKTALQHAREAGRKGGLARARGQAASQAATEAATQAATVTAIPSSYAQGASREVEVEAEREVEKPSSASAEGNTGDSKTIAAVLLDKDSTAQYLLRRLTDWDPAWQSITSGALMKLGQRFGAAVVGTALGYMREEFPDEVAQPYAYLESVCMRIQAEAS